MIPCGIISDSSSFQAMIDNSLTPLMKQYTEIKSRHRDEILFFRMGDFYEMFGEDAVIASGILQIALTSRDKSRENPVQMCGVPYHAAEGYLARLIQAGKRVAICEQVEDPRLAKGLVRREVVRVVTPGTYIPAEMPAEKTNRYIAAVCPRGGITGVAFADLTTGEFRLYETTGSLEDELARLEPNEVLAQKSVVSGGSLSETLSRYAVTGADDAMFDYINAYRALTGHFATASLSGFGCEGMLIGISAAGGLLGYLLDTQKSRLEHIRSVRPVERGRFMSIDAATQQNLEIAKNRVDGSAKATLLGVLDETRTAMGGRLLKQWILQPLLDPGPINARLDSVERLVEYPAGMDAMARSLDGIADIERLISKVTLGICNARDLAALSSGIASVPAVKDALSSFPGGRFSELFAAMDDLDDVRDLIRNTIIDSPPASLRDGGIIRDGYSAELDELRSLSSSGKGYLAALETRERERTGISTLKVGYNRVFGYFIEAPRSKSEKIPDEYTRKQTLAGAERYVTEELKSYEDRVLGAEEKSKALEYEIFADIRDTAATSGSRVQATAAAIAEVDALLSLALVARRRGYCRPGVNDGGRIAIRDGRHPVIEHLSASERFTPNDTELDGGENRLMIITGPNMAGKSTYMRQVALITLMAQAGSFVPAQEAEIGVADRIFTRIGASDMLAKGQSTFMVEMTETANILNNATGRSLILLDEVGRGTSTFDGISIAWAVAEHISRVIGARTLFATHYHELTELALVMDGVKNYNVSVKEWGDEIIFLRRIVEGAADKSYGIQVGRLAGLPEKVIFRAREVLANLEQAELNEAGQPRLAAGYPLEPGAPRQLDLFSSLPDPVVAELLDIDVSRITPLEALNKLYEIQRRASVNNS